MKLIDKLKNALFEEEYVEVEEKPVKLKKKNTLLEDKKKREVKLTKYDDVEEEPIAKKIVSEKVEVKKEEDKTVEEEVAPPKKQFDFPSVEADDFVDNSTPTIDIKVTELEESKKPDPVYDVPYNSVPDYSQPQVSVGKEKEVNLYQTSKEDEYIKNYTSQEYGNYEKVKEKKTFKPSPNISPIYGIIDDNGESVRRIPKREVRLTSATRSEKLGVDDVRRKAYGGLADGFQVDTVSNSIPEEDDDELLVDLRDNDAPEVHKVTVGDAEEYFEDLGLSYDTDYIDAKKAKASGRRLKSDYENVSEASNSEDLPDFLQESNTNTSTSVDESEDNLFDLIDSMYDNS